MLTRHEANGSRGPKEELRAEEQLPGWSLKCGPGGEGAAAKGDGRGEGSRCAGRCAEVRALSSVVLRVGSPS